MAYSHNIYAAFKRLTNKPLDPSGIFESLEALKNYVEREITTAYVGQWLVVIGETEEAGIYFIYAKGKYKKVLDAEAINKLIDAKLNPAVEEINSKFESVNTKIGNIENDIITINGNIDDVKKNLKTEVEKLEKQITDILGGADDIDLNSIKELADKVKLIIENLDTEKIDSLKEITEWIEKHQEELGDVSAIRDALNKINGFEIRLNELDASVNDRLAALEETINASIKQQLEELQKDVNDFKATVERDYAKKDEVSNYLVGVERRISKDFNISGSTIVSASSELQSGAIINSITLTISNISIGNNITKFALVGIGDNQDTTVFAELDSKITDDIITEVGTTIYNLKYTVNSENFKIGISLTQTGTISGSVDVVYIN